MLNIQVLGKGLIPRGYGLAPRKAPFKADLNHIGVILQTPGLEVNYVSPEDGRMRPLTPKNLKRVWEKYSDWKPQVKPAEDPSRPVVPGSENTGGNPPPAPPVEPPKDITPPAEELSEQPKEGATDPVTPPAINIQVPPVTKADKPADDNKDNTPAAADPAQAPTEEKKDETSEEPKTEEKKDDPFRPIRSPEEIARQNQQNRNGKNNQHRH